MRRHRLLVLLAMVGIAALATPTAIVWPWHGTGGPTGTGVASGPTFSNVLAPLLPGRGYRTCILGNFRGLDPSYVPIGSPPLPNPGHAAEHHWKYLSRAAGAVTLLLTVRSFNTTTDPGKKVTLTAAHASGTTSVSLVYPNVAGPTGEIFGTLTVPVAAGVAYDLTITAQQALGDPDPVNANALHYRIGVLGPGSNQVELAYGEPTLEYQEPGALYRWAVNLAGYETGMLEVAVDPQTGPGVPGQTDNITYAVFDPALGFPPPAVAGALNAPVSVALPHVISFTNPTPVVKTYIVAVELGQPIGTLGHYRLRKLSGPDKGIYVLNCPEPGIVGIDIKPGSFPNSINLGSGGSVPVAIFSRPGFDATTVNPATVTLAGAGVKLTGKGTPVTSQEDVNGDTLVDLVVHIQTEALELTVGDTIAVLGGRTFGGTPVVGADSVRVVQ